MALADSEITDGILNAFYTVYNRLGYGFLEKVYENAMVLELTKRGFGVKQQSRIPVYYDGHVVGDYFADLIINERVILELKAAEQIDEAHLAQLLNYLRGTTCEVGLVLNFGPKPTFERRYFSNRNKRNLPKRS